MSWTATETSAAAPLLGPGMTQLLVFSRSWSDTLVDSLSHPVCSRAGHGGVGLSSFPVDTVVSSTLKFPS